jgi:hypothetical protein
MNTDDMKNILEKVDSMQLSEGAYLEFSNMLKTTFDKKEKERKVLLKMKHRDVHVKFHGKQCIDIEILNEYVYKEHDTEWDIEVNGMFIPTVKCSNMISNLKTYYRLNYTSKVETILHGVSLETTEKEMRKHLASKDYDDMEDPDSGYDEDGNHYSLDYILSVMTGMNDD